MKNYPKKIMEPCFNKVPYLQQNYEIPFFVLYGIIRERHSIYKHEIF